MIARILLVLLLFITLLLSILLNVESILFAILKFGICTCVKSGGKKRLFMLVSVLILCIVKLFVLIFFLFEHRGCLFDSISGIAF